MFEGMADGDEASEWSKRLSPDNQRRRRNLTQALRPRHIMHLTNDDNPWFVS